MLCTPALQGPGLPTCRASAAANRDPLHRPGSLFVALSIGPLQNLPADWQCPTCGAEKKLFVSKQRQVAGFAENQG